MSNGKLSKSNVNLSISSTNLNDSLQSLDYNRITPLPIVTSNAPFEQTFRITVLLPKDQLYVARLGARVPLSKLLELICDNKQLDSNKYEFRNPGKCSLLLPFCISVKINNVLFLVDPSQVYSCDLTIGAVGLSEIRLCHKNESYDSFNTDEILKLQRTSTIRDSLSSSEFSSRFSKHTNKTTSPYSSTNSLNSMDSSSLNYTRQSFLMAAPSSTQPQHIYNSNNNGNFTKPVKVVAPPRKKRTAPRPPSQISIPEKGVLVTSNGNQCVSAHIKIENGNRHNGNYNSDQDSLQGLTPDRCVSTPNLTTTNANVNHYQNNLRYNHQMSDSIALSDDYPSRDVSPAITVNGYGDDTVVYAQVQKKNAQNLLESKFVDNVGDRNSTDSNGTAKAGIVNVIEGSQNGVSLPEPTPRKRNVLTKKKSAPAPPPRNSLCLSDCSEDVLSTQTLSSESSGTLMYNGDYATVQELQTQHQPQNSNFIPTPKARHVNETSLRNGIEEETTLIVQNSHSLIYDEPKAISRFNCGSSSTLLNANHMENIDFEVQKYAIRGVSAQNVSKTMLNCSPTPEQCEPDIDENECVPSSTSLRTSPDSDSCYESHLDRLKQGSLDDDNASKQADSGIGEPSGTSPLPDSLPVSELSAAECKSNFESSSDDDDLIKVYNFKLGKTMVKPLNDDKNSEEFDVIRAPETAVMPVTIKGELTLTDSTTNDYKLHPATTSLTVIATETVVTTTATPEAVKLSSSKEIPNWNISLPISPPPTFADESKAAAASTTTSIYQNRESTPDTPITPKIMERPILDFAALQKDEIAQEDYSRKQPQINDNDSKTLFDTSPMSPTTPLNGLVEELSLIINGKGVDSLIKKSPKNHQIEAATTNTLNNFSISTATAKNNEQTVKSVDINDEDKLYRKKNTNQHEVGISKQTRRSINRADSFHSIVMSSSNDCLNDITTTKVEVNGNRSSSQLSLTKLETGQTNGVIGSLKPMDRRCSSSELSIGESPSLQSLEVIKTILKNNRHNFSDTADGNRDSKRDKSNGELLQSVKKDDEILVVNARRPSTELMFSSLELKPKKSQIIIKEQEESSLTPNLPPAIAPKPSSKMNVPKVYRYSGPPSINLSTWNERPKTQVAIKNEGDYIFGGKGTSNAQMSRVNETRGVSRSPTKMTASGSNRMQSVPDCYTTDSENTTSAKRFSVGKLDIITRMGIPDGEFKVPILVKPLDDVVVESSEENFKSENTASENSEAEKSSTTLPRVVKKWHTQHDGGSSTTLRPVLHMQNVGRKEYHSGSDKTTPAVFFGQNTLRRTGLKDKILATEKSSLSSTEETNDTAKNTTRNFQLKKQISDSNAVPPPPPPIAISSAASQFKNTTKSAPVIPSLEPRDQLLEAIRTFNRSQLKRKP